MRLAKLAALATAVLLVSASAATAARQANARVICINVFYSAISYCIYPDGSVMLKNVSFSVVEVTADDFTTTLRPVHFALSTVADYAADAAAPASCGYSSCTLPPGRSLTADDPFKPFRLSFSFNLTSTVSRNAALTLAGMLVNKFRTPGQRLAIDAGECASQIGDLADTPQDWQSAFRKAIPLYTSCRGVARTIQERPGEETRVSRQAVSWAKSLDGGAWIDQMFRLFGKVARR